MKFTSRSMATISTAFNLTFAGVPFVGVRGIARSHGGTELYRNLSLDEIRPAFEDVIDGIIVTSEPIPPVWARVSHSQATSDLRLLQQPRLVLKWALADNGSTVTMFWGVEWFNKDPSWENALNTVGERLRKRMIQNLGLPETSVKLEEPLIIVPDKLRGDIGDLVICQSEASSFLAHFRAAAAAIEEHYASKGLPDTAH